MLIMFGLRDVVLIVALGAVFVVEDVRAFGRGAPTSTCFTRYPKHHGTGTQLGVSPYQVSVSPTQYRPNDLVEVTISGSKPFTGFELAGYRVPSSSECQALEIVGSFSDPNDGKTKIFTCPAAAGSSMNLVTHKNKEPVRSVKFKWTAPPYHANTVIFQTTVVEDFYTFWTTLNATLTMAPSAQLEPYHYQEACVKQISQTVELSGCGDIKSCFLYPRHCQENDCIAAVSFEYRENQDDYMVEMYADPGSTPGYVGIAFSEDDEMANDETFVCAAITDEMSIQHGLNPGKYNERVVSNVVSQAEVKLEDGRLSCRFVMPGSSTVKRIKASTVFSNSPQTVSSPFNKSDTAWRIQLAWGPVMLDSNVITKHKDMPATTFSSVHIREPGTHRGTAFHVLVRVHGALMIVAWTFLSGIVTVIARHYRDMMAKKRLFGTKIWFQVHRALAILVAVLTGLGLIIIFSHYGTPIRDYADPHAYWGLAASVAVGLQLIAGMLRPGIDSKFRILFNWGHRILGHASHVIAAITMFLAFDIKYVTEDQHDFGTTTLAIWVGVQLLWHIGFEVFSIIMRRNEADSYQVAEEKEKEASWIPGVVLTVYVLFLAGCCISILCAFLFY